MTRSKTVLLCHPVHIQQQLLVLGKHINSVSQADLGPAAAATILSASLYQLVIIKKTMWDERTILIMPPKFSKGKIWIMDEDFRPPFVRLGFLSCTRHIHEQAGEFSGDEKER